MVFIRDEGRIRSRAVDDGFVVSTTMVKCKLRTEMPYKRTFSTLGCPDMTLEEAIVLSNNAAITGIELRALHGSLDIPSFLASNYGRPYMLADRMKRERAKIVSLSTSLKLAGSMPPDFDHFIEFIPWADALGIPYLRVFDGGKAANEATHGEMSSSVAWFREQRARRHWNTDIMIETHDALSTSEAIISFLKRAPGTKILWDAHHTWKMGGEDPLTTWRAIRPHVVHIHVKDSVSIRNENRPYTFKLPGTGEFPMKGLKEVLWAEYSGPLSLEWERLWHSKLPRIEDAFSSAIRRGWW